jgi:hypothetical protein
MHEAEARVCANTIVAAALAIEQQAEDDELGARLERMRSKLQTQSVQLLSHTPERTGMVNAVAVLFLLSIARSDRALVSEDAQARLLNALGNTHDHTVRVSAAEALAHCYSAKAPEIWNRLWLKNLATLTRWAITSSSREIHRNTHTQHS